MTSAMTNSSGQWDEHGFEVLPGQLTPAELAPALAELRQVFPSADEFHDDVDPVRNIAFRGDEYGGLITFPFASVELCLLSVHPRLVELARSLLKTPDIRIYSAEAWVKFTGACNYEQEHHRDFLNHTVVVPSDDAHSRNLEMFVFLHEVSEDLGPTHVVSTTLTAELPLLPHCVSRADFPALYASEVSASGPAGTVLAYRGETFHRATNLTASRGARYTLHSSFRPASHEWVGRQGWGDRSFHPSWNPFVARATPAQLELFGWPAPGHDYWTAQTLSGLKVRYPDLDTTPWERVE
jgi:hypothetical protein